MNRGLIQIQKVKYTLLIVLSSLVAFHSYSQDTLRVMTYNVLHYGDQCQGSNSFLHTNLKTIVQYSRPDVLGMVKAQVVKLSENDFVGVSPVGFGDSILIHSFNASFPNTYDYCPLVSFSNDPDGDMDFLFYNKNKLGFLSVSNLCAFQEDFNLYKLYYKDPNLAKTKDTTFLYFILNHTVSGTSSNLRDHQDSTVVQNLKTRFKHLPNLISMGDFNTHSSYEPGYQLLTSSVDTSFLFSDPPYFPDKKLTYPSNWSQDASLFSGYLNTSTREGIIPNACGTSGGAKGWYLHILLSPWLVNGKNYVKYVPGSYVTLGNDGNRLGRSINDSINDVKNSALPENVVNSIFQFSDKYPVMVKFVVASNISGTSPVDPELNVVTGVSLSAEDILLENPVNGKMVIHFQDGLLGKQSSLHCYNNLGQLIQLNNFSINSNEIYLDANFDPGLYLISIQTGRIRKVFRIIKK